MVWPKRVFLGTDSISVDFLGGIYRNRYLVILVYWMHLLFIFAQGVLLLRKVLNNAD